jgi:hypothetical protein
MSRGVTYQEAFGRRNSASRAERLPPQNFLTPRPLRPCGSLTNTVLSTGPRQKYGRKFERLRCALWEQQQADISKLRSRIQSCRLLTEQPSFKPSNLSFSLIFRTRSYLCSSFQRQYNCVALNFLFLSRRESFSQVPQLMQLCIWSPPQPPQVVET